jgi:FAD binding domain
MTQQPDLGVQTQNLNLVQGLIQNEGSSYSNWGLHRATKPAVYAEPISYADMQAIVRDSARFPTPVNPVGSMMSVSSTFVNDSGTMVCLRKLDEVIGLERDAAGREVVRVQAGCRLKKLNMWLQAHGLEVPFQAEIGEASVGSVTAVIPRSLRSMVRDIFPLMSSPSPMLTKMAPCALCRTLRMAPHFTNSNVRSACWESSSNASSKRARRRSAGPTFRLKVSQLQQNLPPPC